MLWKPTGFARDLMVAVVVLGGFLVLRTWVLPLLGVPT